MGLNWAGGTPAQRGLSSVALNSTVSSRERQRSGAVDRPVPESVPQSSWGPWLTQIARARNLDAATIATAGISNYAGFVTSTPLNLYVAKTGSDTAGKGFDSTTPCLTIARALTLARFWHVGGGNIVINLGSGDWAEDITVNGRLWGDMNYSAIPNIGTVWPSMLVFQGNGAANTTISGTGNFGGTLIVSQHAIVGLKNLKITGNKNGFQSALFVQMAGYVHVFGGVEFGICSAEQMHAENAGSSIQIWENYTLSGGGSAAMGAGDQAEIIIGGGVGTVSGTPAYSVAFIFARSGGGIQFNLANPFSGAATGRRFELLSNAWLEIPSSTAFSEIPGNALGLIESGARVRIGGGSYVTVSSSTGTGTGGTTTVDSGSSLRGGAITITAGTAASAAGAVVLAMPWSLRASDGSYPYGVANLVNGTGTWPVGSMVEVVHGSDNPTINWRTGDVSALVSTKTYFITYNQLAD
jgi:hypothetical protein